VEVIEQIKFDIIKVHSEMVRAECTMWADAHCQPPRQMGLEEDEDDEGVDLGEFADGGRVEPDENNRFAQCSAERCTAFRDKNVLLCSRHLKNRRTEYMDKELAKRLVRGDTATATCQKYYVNARTIAGVFFTLLDPIRSRRTHKTHAEALWRRAVEHPVYKTVAGILNNFYFPFKKLPTGADRLQIH
jgi:hypothetical protein